MYKQYITYDSNNNGQIDNDHEERANIEFNAKHIQKLQQEINKLKRKNAVSETISGRPNEYASSSKLAEELTDGIQHITFNNVSKTVVFKNNNTPTPSCIQIGTRDNNILNVNNILFNNLTSLSGLTSSLTDNHPDNVVPTLTLLNNTIGGLGEVYAPIDHNHDEVYSKLDHNHDSTYAPIEHTHLTTDVSQKYEEEEEYQEEEDDGEGNVTTVTKYRTVTKYKPLDDILTGKADVTHNHDDKYIQLINIVSQIQSISEQLDAIKIPNVAAIINYCQDFLTAAGIQNNAQLQELLKGQSAFDIWKSQQTPKPQGEPDYTYSDFIAAISGGQGAKGDKGDTGDSAFQVWASQQPSRQEPYTYEEYITAITGPQGPQGPKGDTDSSGKTWLDYVVAAGTTFKNVMGGIYYAVQIADVVKAWRRGIIGASRSARGLNMVLSALDYIPLTP